MSESEDAARRGRFPTNPAALVAVLVAAVRTKDRELARAARRELEEQHGIRISFVRETEVGHE